MARTTPEPQRIFEPKDVQQLLEGWLFHSHKCRQRHDLAARHCDRNRLWLGGSAAVFSAIVGTSLFAVLEKHVPDSPTNLTKLAIISTAILSAILTGLSTFLNLAERTEKHRSTGVRYKKMIRELERILSQPVVELNRDDPSVITIQQELDELEKSAPVVPERLYRKIENAWKKQCVKPVKLAGDLYPCEGEKNADEKSESGAGQSSPPP